MTQLSIIFALLAAIALGNATHSGVNPVQQSNSRDGVSLDKVSKAEPPQEQTGVGEGGWPAF